jgi:hypothetical protein
MDHYELGTKHDCKNASAAGLLGGLQQMGNNRWFITWGVIPMHDRRLVVMEELKGASTDVLSKLTDMRSSGIAEISKIEKRRAHARTRLIMISNPRGGKALANYSFGVESCKELLGSQEDVRRFDLAVIPAAGQIDANDLNKLNSSRPKIEHKYDREVCKRAILWAWTRKKEQIEFEEGAEALCLERANRLCKKFSESMPLCDKGTMRYKIARLAISAAAMTFSTLDKSVEVVLVRKCHIDFVADFIENEYSRDKFGYARFSAGELYKANIIQPEEVMKTIATTKYPNEFLTQLLHNEEINLRDIQDWCEVDRDTANGIMSSLARRQALRRVKMSYNKTPAFITLIKETIDKGKLDSYKGDF